MKAPLYKAGGKIKTQGKAMRGLAPFVSGQTITRPLCADEDQWWYDTGVNDEDNDHSWGDPDNGDGQYFTTIHHRQVRIGKGDINDPGVYTQTAIVTRTDGDGEPVKVILVTGKTTEIISYE